MWFIIIVLLITAYYVFDWLLSFWGKRLIPFFAPKTMVHLRERLQQTLWIEKHRKGLKAETLETIKEVKTLIEDAEGRYKAMTHAELKACSAKVNQLFKDKLIAIKQNGFLEFLESVWVVVVIALMIRFFLFESFRVPTGSMVPSIYIGDMLFVNKYIYGLRPPFTTYHFFKQKDPTRGEVVIFIYPKDTKYDFVKRVIGLPGDKIKLDGRRIFVNEKEITRVKDKDFSYIERSGGERPTEWYTETNIDGVSYPVLYSRIGDLGSNQDGCILCNTEFTVPAGHLFVMGDNRDVSSDSRYWGFVPLDNLKGRASMIWFSVSLDGGFHLNRVGSFIK